MTATTTAVPTPKEFEDFFLSDVESAAQEIETSEAIPQRCR